MTRHQRGFTLVEILVVLALIGLLALVVVPNLGGLLSRGEEQGYNSDRKAIQAAVDSYYTDPSTKVGGVRQYPTKGGTGGTPSWGGASWDTENYFIYFDKLIAKGYLSDAPSSAGTRNRVDDDPVTMGSGSYNWYVDANGRVKSKYGDSNTEGFQAGAYP